MRSAIRSRGARGWAVAPALAAGVLLAPVRGAATSAEPPSVVIIYTDDQRADTLWAMPNVQTLLADRGVTFTNAFVVNPVCCPSRSSLLTGKYSHSTGVWRNVMPYGGFPALDDSSTLATWLRGAGYSTGLLGKYLNGYWDAPTYVPPGWDRWRVPAFWILRLPAERRRDPRVTLGEARRLLSGRARRVRQVVPSTPRPARCSCTSRPTRRTSPRSPRRVTRRPSLTWPPGGRPATTRPTSPTSLRGVGRAGSGGRRSRRRSTRSA